MQHKMIKTLSAILTANWFIFCKSTELPWGDVNVIVLTDVHSWVGGHGRHENLDADYGDVLSFYLRVKEMNPDTLFVMNGDFMDGTGLSTNPPVHLLPILRRMPWDAVNMGNHELYNAESVEYMSTSGFIDHWNGAYLTSNSAWASSNAPIGARFKVVTTTHHRILTFGFLYNFQGNCNTTIVHRVQDVVEEEWFVEALTNETYDAIMVLAHMDYLHPLVSVIYKAIRRHVGSQVPIQFVNGHSHRRGYAPLEENGAAFEAGRFLDTVGFVSFPTVKDGRVASNPDSRFNHVFINATKGDLQTHGGGPPLRSDPGSSLTHLIENTQESLHLHDRVGFSNETYTVHEFEGKRSIYQLFINEVVPGVLPPSSGDVRLFVVNTGAFRYDLLKGKVSLDDVIALNPFDNPLMSIAQRVRPASAETFLRRLQLSYDGLPVYAFTKPNIESNATYEVMTTLWNAKKLCQYLEESSVECSRRPILDKESKPLRMNDVWIEFISQHSASREPETTRSHAAAAATTTAIAIAIVFGIARWRQQRRTEPIADNLLPGESSRLL